MGRDVEDGESGSRRGYERDRRRFVGTALGDFRRRDHVGATRKNSRSRSPDSRRRRERDRASDSEEESFHRKTRRTVARRWTDSRENSRDRRKVSSKPGPVKRNEPLPSQSHSFALSKGEEPAKPKEKPNFGNTGLLAAASNQVTQPDGSTIILKYHEPPEARKSSPRDQWKLFVFKGTDLVDTIELNSRSCWLIGRETAIVDLSAEHPSISKQHAAIQFRHTEKRNEFGDKLVKVKPYLIDLDSANGTIINGQLAPASRYLELRDKDLLQFGSSTREYVLMLAPKD